MPWNAADRTKYEVIRARYSSDMSGTEMALIAPLLPPSTISQQQGDWLWQPNGLSCKRTFATVRLALFGTATTSVDSARKAHPSGDRND